MAEGEVGGGSGPHPQQRLLARYPTCIQRFRKREGAVQAWSAERILWKLIPAPFPAHLLGPFLR